MVNTHVFPQDGDDDDAANFGQLVGQSNLTGFVERGLDLTVDYSVPETSVSTGLAFVSENTATAPQTGEDRLNPTYAVQLAQTTVSLIDNDVNFLYIEPDLGTDDNASVVPYTDESNATTNALKIAEVDTSSNTKTKLNRQPDLDASELDVADDIVDDTGTVIWDARNNYVPQGRLENDSVDVAGNSVSLGGSTTVDYVDLNDTSSSFPIPNGDLSNSSVSVAGNSVILGSSTTVDYVDLNDTAASFPIPNTDLSNSSVTVSAGDGLKSGGSVSLGGSVTLDIKPADFAGTFLSDDGRDDLQVEIGRGLENDGTGQIQFDEDTAYTFTLDQTFNAGLSIATGQSIEDGSGTQRVELTSSRTAIFDEQGRGVFDSSAGAFTSVTARSSTPFRLFDGEGTFTALSYSTSSSAPGTLELTNSDLNIGTTVATIDSTTGDIKTEGKLTENTSL